MATSALGHRYVDYPATVDTPNVVVDGSPNASTHLVLSHWPGNRTPAALKRDLSAEIAFAYLDHPEFHRAGLPVTNNHFDEDGLVSVYVLVEPDAALARRERLVEVARAGDFSVTSDPVAARIAFAVSAGAVRGYDQLDRFAELVEHPDRFEDAWRPEWEQLEAACAALDSGEVTVESRPEVDLAVVRVAGPSTPVHPVAVHRVTPMMRVLTVSPGAAEVQYRYETWVDLQSPHVPRVDLTPLARELSAQDDATWDFDGVEAIMPRLRPVSGTSRLAPEAFVDRVDAFLRAADASVPPTRP